MSKKAVKLPEVALEAIRTHVEHRLACYGVRAYMFELKETPTMSYDFTLEQVLQPSGLGIFRHALKQCEVTVTIWTLTREENEVGQRWLVEVRLGYELFNGGTNGCHTNIEFYINDSGRIVERY